MENVIYCVKGVFLFDLVVLLYCHPCCCPPFHCTALSMVLRLLTYNVCNFLEADLLLDNEEEYIHPYSDEYVLLERKMRNRLSFFFMNPIEKWKTRGRFPYKFVIQIIKIILVTVQVMDKIINILLPLL